MLPRLSTVLRLGSPVGPNCATPQRQSSRWLSASDTSDKISTISLDFLNYLNQVSGPNFKGCDWQTSDEIEIDRFLPDSLNGKPFCNRVMYGVLLGLSQLWTPENERRIPKDLPILMMSGTRDPGGGMTTTVKALIDRYQKNGARDASYISYHGVRHEPMNDFSRELRRGDVARTAFATALKSVPASAPQTVLGNQLLALLVLLGYRPGRP